VTETVEPAGDEPYADERRLAFGRVAQTYDEARPSYPPAAIDAVMRLAALAPPARILEVGAGTGKATELLAQRGFEVLALEPSPDMARVARAKLGRYPRVRIAESEFEGWRPAEPWPALFSAQAWHWIAPAARYALAHAALAPGGTLAALWTFPDWPACPLHEPLADVYRTAAPQLTGDFPMHPDSDPVRLGGDWETETAAGGRFTAAEVLTFPWVQAYSSSEYVRLLGTHQDHILLSDDERARLMEAVARCIDGSGGVLEMPWVTYVCLARRA
jgi:SAM-dependent methyltransferase